MRGRIRFFARLLLGSCWFAFAAFGCSDDDPPPCANGQCFCQSGASCQLPCFAPPCHIDCAGDNPSCLGECGNGGCFCGPRSHCQFGCKSPPCHVTCDPASECAATCANGTCRCESGSTCDFTCLAGPCHVECAGQNQSCDGECANGECSCGPSSTCHFVCRDGNCPASCGLGSSCVLECPNGRAGEQGCRFEDCAAGEPVVCPDGRATVCGASCPAN
jgi:hypothetical protein